jgi:amino acid transporter
MRTLEILARVGGALFFILTTALALAAKSSGSLLLIVILGIFILVSLFTSLAGLALKNQLLSQEPEYARDDVSQEHTTGYVFLGIGAALIVIAAIALYTFSLGLSLGILFWTFPLWLIPAGITMLTRKTFEEYKLLKERKAEKNRNNNHENEDEENIDKKNLRAGIDIGVILVMLLVLILFV